MTATGPSQRVAQVGLIGRSTDVRGVWEYSEVRPFSDQQQLRSRFDSAAALYDRARPDYPEALFDTLLRHIGVEAGARVLEVGSATGKATVPLARRGLSVTCVELGEHLAAIARERLAVYPAVEVVTADFETWVPPEAVSFDLVVAATSWHWIDPLIGFPKVAGLLGPGGHLAVWGATHVFPAGGDTFFREIQDVYDEIGEGRAPAATWPTPDELAPLGLDEASVGLFETIAVERFDWEIPYDADSYIDLLNTFSGHLAMQPWQRHRLYSEIRRRLDQRSDGRLRRHWGAVLEVARPTSQ